ncbi:MAG: cob(I)yrinic acid a,c-diamide adenosyltransferase [Balneola sp.]
MKIYTKKGDSGDTSLFGGQRVSKSSMRIEAYGTVDELNSVIGVATSHGVDQRSKELLDEIQIQLFVLGSDLATPLSKKLKINRISDEEITFLENAIDELEESLEPLTSFILPGGSPSGATLHVARTVCRRAERLAVECAKQDEISGFAIKYLNRLSDFLFVLARLENKQSGSEETKWLPES